MSWVDEGPIVFGGSTLSIDNVNIIITSGSDQGCVGLCLLFCFEIGAFVSMTEWTAEVNIWMR